MVGKDEFCTTCTSEWLRKSDGAGSNNDAIE